MMPPRLGASAGEDGYATSNQNSRADMVVVSQHLTLVNQRTACQMKSYNAAAEQV